MIIVGEGPFPLANFASSVWAIPVTQCIPNTFLDKNGMSFDETTSNCVLPCKLQCTFSYPLQAAFPLQASRPSSPMRKTVSASPCQQSTSVLVPWQVAAVRLIPRALVLPPALSVLPCLQTSWSSGRTSRATGTGRGLHSHVNTTLDMSHCARASVSPSSTRRQNKHPFSGKHHVIVLTLAPQAQSAKAFERHRSSD